MRRSKRKYHRSLGELISSFAYFVAGVWLITEANDHLDVGNALRGYGTLLCGLLCLAGTCRYQIHNLFARIKDMRK